MSSNSFVGSRRAALKAGVAGALAVPAVASAQQTYRWRMTTTWPAGLPFYQVGPGSAAAVLPVQK